MSKRNTTNLKLSPVLTAVIGTVLVCASIHIGVIFYVALMTGNWQLLNVFYILQLHLLFPSVIDGTAMFVISYVFLFIAFGIVYYLVTSHETK